MAGFTEEQVKKTNLKNITKELKVELANKLSILFEDLNKKINDKKSNKSGKSQKHSPKTTISPEGSVSIDLADMPLPPTGYSLNPSPSNASSRCDSPTNATKRMSTLSNSSSDVSYQIRNH